MIDHTFISARFTNDSKTTSQARWKDNNDETIFRNSYVEVDENNLHYKNLLELISEAELHENTVRAWRQEREQYDQLLVDIAKTTGDWVDVNDDSKFLDRLVLLLAKDESEINNEEIFKFKLAVFDHPKVADSNDRVKKSKIRKAKTYIEIIQLLSEF